MYLLMISIRKEGVSGGASDIERGSCWEREARRRSDGEDRLVHKGDARLRRQIQRPRPNNRGGRVDEKFGYTWMVGVGGRSHLWYQPRVLLFSAR